MKSYLFLVGVICCMCNALAYDPFEGLLKQGEGCFDLIEVPPECNITLAENFKPTVPKYGTNEPTTLAYLFTPTNRDKPEPLHMCGGRLPSNTAYDPDADTEIFVHGWLDGACRTSWMREMKEQLFQRGRYNVLLVDWTWGNLDYFLAYTNCRIAGQQIGFIISNIIEQTGVTADKFHITGPGYGATVGGFVGRFVENATGTKMRRITGLDPAFAPLKDAPPEDKLTYRDAQIVDIIHANGFQCFVLGVGDERQLGHADFYPNGGQIQTGCIPAFVEALLKGDFLYAYASLDPRLCSHLQSVQFYKMSINPHGCEYLGVAFDSSEDIKDKNFRNCDRAVMGMDYEYLRPKTDKRQKYYLETTDICPYYDKKYVLKTKSTSCAT